MMADLWEVKKDGVIYAQSTIENCGYCPERLKSLRAAGYKICKNGKVVR